MFCLRKRHSGKHLVVELVLGDTPYTGKSVPAPLSAVCSFCVYLKN